MVTWSLSTNSWSVYHIPPTPTVYSFTYTSTVSSEHTFQWCPGCEAFGSLGTGHPTTMELISTTIQHTYAYIRTCYTCNMQQTYSTVHVTSTQRNPLPYLCNCNGSEEAPSDTSSLSWLIAEGDVHPSRLPVADTRVLVLHHLKLCMHSPHEWSAPGDFQSCDQPTLITGSGQHKD